MKGAPGADPAAAAPPLAAVRIPRTLLRAERVYKRFGPLPVLRGVDVEIERGRVTAVLGPNGAGKSTLIKMVLGLVRPDAGRVTLDGEPIGRSPEYRARIGYMPQAARFPGNLTPREVIAMLTDLRGAGAGRDEELLEAFELEDAMDRRLGTLSGGTRQRVNAALAFLFAPELLVLDEPTAGLDPLASSVFKDKVRREVERGRTVLLTSHLMGEVESLADRLVFLLEGRVRFSGTPAELRERTGERSLERGLAGLMRRGEGPHGAAPGASPRGEEGA